MEKHIDKIVNVIKSTSPEKLQDIFAIKHWIQTTSINVLKFSVCGKAEEIVQEFSSKHSEIKKYVQKRLPTRLLILRHEAAFAYSMNAYLEEIDPSLNY